MPLQIRRGPTADRLAITPLEGEIVYDTTLKAVYIGDGSTPGGAPVTLFSADDSRTISAQMFLGESLNDNSIHSGITFQYIGNRLIATASPDLSDYPGTIRSQGFVGDLYADDSTKVFDVTTGIFSGNFQGDIYGSVYADDSTRLVDGLRGSVNLNGTVKGDIIPDQNEAYDLGSSSFKFKDIYLSGTSIYLGDAVITSSAGTVDLPIGSTIGGNPFGLDLGQTYEVSIIGNVLGEDSSVLVNASTGSINLNETILDHVVPADSEQRNLGDFSKKFKTLYLTEGANLYIGNAVISSSSTIIDLPAGSTIGGSPIGSGAGSGDVVGPGGAADEALARFDGVTGKIIQSSSASLTDAGVLTTNTVIANLTGTVTGDVYGTVYGAVRGELVGSVFADDSSSSTPLVDAQNGILNGNLVATTAEVTTLTVDQIEDLSGSLRVTSATGNISFRTPLGAVFVGVPSDDTDGDLYLNKTAFNDDLEKGLVFRTSQGFNPEIDGLNFLRSNGSSSASTAVTAGDVLGKFVFAGHDGSDFQKSVTLGVAVEGVSGSNVTSAFYMTSKDSGGNDVYRFRALTDGRLAIGALLSSDTGSGALEIYNTSYIASNAGAGQPIIIKQYFDNTDSNNLTSIRNRGTRSAPSPVLPGDKLFEISVLGNATGATAPISSRINFFTPSDGTIGAGKVPGLISLEVADYNGTVTAAVQVKADLKLHALYGVKGDVVGSVYADDSSVVIDATEGGKITAPSATLSDFLQLPVFADDSARSTAIPTPAAGMVIFMQSGSTPAATNQIQFFNGSNWVSL